MKKLSLIKLSETELKDIQAARADGSSIIRKFHGIGCNWANYGSMIQGGNCKELNLP